MPASFKLYFTRNIVIEKNMWRRTVMELIVMLAILLVVGLNPIAHSRRFLGSNENFEDTRQYATSRLDDLNALKSFIQMKRDKTKYLLAYAPTMPVAKTLTEAVVRTLKLNGTIGYASDSILQNQFDDRTTLAGVVFHDLTDGQIPKKLALTIRYPSAFRTVEPFLTEDKLWVTRCSGALLPNRDNVHDEFIDTDIYIREGFLQLQHQVFLEWYRRLSNTYPTEYGEPQAEIRIIRDQQSNDFCPQSGISNIPTFMYNFLFLLPFLNLIWNWTQQHQENVFVHEWHYGFSFCTQWLCNFIVSLIHMEALALIAWVIVYIIWTLTESQKRDFKPMLLMLCLIMLYIVGLVLCAILLTMCIADSVNAVLVGLIFWIANYATFSIILQRYWEVSGYYVVITFLIFINNLFPFSVNFFRRMFINDDSVNDTDVYLIFGCACIYILVHFVIILFKQWFWPGRHLSRRAVHGKIYKKNHLSKEDRLIMMVTRLPSWHNFEFGNVSSEEVLRLRNISTLYHGTDRRVLKNVSLRLYKGEIFVLLGHMGSGKATLLRVIAGLKIAHRGSMELLGKNFYENIKLCRSVTDFRMEFNSLPGYMTVEQVIRYYVTVKMHEMDKAAIHFECIKWWEYLEHFIDSSQKLVRKLHFGQRRLLSLCCCLASGTKVVVLYEPVQYLTSRETQAYWDILEHEKSSRTIIVATCSIDDADRIANRIGVFNMGILEASGTPFFLRDKFGSGVELVLLKKAHVPDGPITMFLQKYIPNIQPDNEIGDQLMYKIDREKRTIMQQLLIHLERERKSLGIDNIRVLGPEVSDIYMSLETTFRLHQQNIPDVTQTFKYSVISKSELRKQQIRAMLFKKIIHQAPNVWSIVMIFASAVLIILIGRLAHVLEVPKERRNGMDLGFPLSAGQRSYLPNAQQCGFIEIVKHNRESSFSKVNSQSHLFHSKSFTCGRGDFISHLKDHKHEGDEKGFGAVEVENKQALIAWASQDVFHAAPMTLNVLHNLILQFAYPNEDSFMTTIENHPMPTPLSLKINLLDNQLTHINQPLTMGTVMPITISIFILPLVEENARNLRVLQVIAGVSLDIYWVVSFLWDFLTYFIYSVLFLIVMSFASIEAFSFTEKMLLLLLMDVFGIAAILCTYFLSMLFFTKILRAFLVSLLVQLLSGLVLFVIYWEVANSNTIFFYLASVSPAFSLLDGVSNIYAQSREMRSCEQKCAAHNYCSDANMHEVVPQCRFNSYFQWADPGILPAITFMSLSAFIFSLMIFCIELQRKERKYFTTKNLKSMRTLCYPFDDADVADVKMKIADADMHRCKQSAFLVDQLEASLPKRETRLHTVSFAINKYTSMGIFGPRNCGKSHLVRQLIGQDGFCFGEIYVRGLDFKYELASVQRYIGYCPQHYGYVGCFTPTELLRLMCMIRGVPDENISEKIRDLSQMLNMGGWMNRRIGGLSLERRRKVNIAMSLIAYNKIIILDEPTYGMPATTRREIWNILRYIRFCGKTIIFTTTDELEAKVLADFIILYENNEMLAIGSLQYIRYKYSHGFYLEVRLIRDGQTLEMTEENLRKDIENLTRFIKFLHERSELIGSRENWLKYYIPVETIIYSYLYGALEKNKTRLNIYDYSVYQATTGAILQNIQTQRESFKQRQSDVSNISNMSRYSRYSSLSRVSRLSNNV